MRSLSFDWKTNEWYTIGDMNYDINVIERIMSDDGMFYIGQMLNLYFSDRVSNYFG